MDGTCAILLMTSMSFHKVGTGAGLSLAAFPMPSLRESDCDSPSSPVDAVERIDDMSRN